MRKLLLVLLLFAPLAQAQTTSLPKYSSVYVNDLADVLSESAEQSMTDDLSTLKTETGVEMSVLTIKTRDAYGFHSSFESFARDTFNDWGIGDAAKNNGILLLVAIEDREMRVELGSGYSGEMDRIAEKIIDRSILPDFADGNFEFGILKGTTEIAIQIARGQSDSGSSFNPANPIFGGVCAIIAFAIGRMFVANRRQRQCPACKSDDIHRKLRKPHSDQYECRNCGHLYLIQAPSRRDNDRSSGDSGGSFGGGSSSGGGASGRW